MELAKTLWESGYHAQQVPLIREVAGLSKSTKRTYAQVLARAANVSANQNLYDRAIEAATLSVRYFLELGSWFDMYAQIQALSGILHIARRPQAKRVNHFGLIPALRMYQGLRSAYYDSAASISMESGNWRSARRLLKQIAAHDQRTYTQSKFAATLAASPESFDRREAGRIFYSVALPEARRSGEFLGYTLRHTASFAIGERDFHTASVLLREAEEDCVRRGELYSLRMVRRLEGLLGLLIEP